MVKKLLSDDTIGVIIFQVSKTLKKSMGAKWLVH